MACLFDSSVLVRALDRPSPQRVVCLEAFRSARKRPGEFFLSTQSSIEFWVVATRPKDVNGLGLTTTEADTALRIYERFFPLLNEPAAIAQHWRQLVRQYNVSGLPAHDARLVALMAAHGIRNIISLNPRDFRRYSAIRVLTPQDVVDGRV